LIESPNCINQLSRIFVESRWVVVLLFKISGTNVRIFVSKTWQRHGFHFANINSERIFMKKLIFPVLLLGAVFAASKATAQPKPYYGPLLFSMPRDTSVPPVYFGQPPSVTTGYLWLDEAMRNYQEYQIESFFNALTWSDTMKTFASTFYQAQDDNPLSFYMWSAKAIHPNPYKGDPGQAQVAFEKQVAQIAGDSGRTSSILTADIIADVMVGDTFCVLEPPAYLGFNMVFVNTTILDEIKGKKVPLCVDADMRAKKKIKGPTIQDTGTIPWATYPVAADTGTCLQFEYSPEWPRASFWGGDQGATLISNGSWWIKPSHEYIVFLNFTGIGSDSTHGYFTLNPGPAALGSGGMYPVVDGIVQDYNDDYGLGASAGLTVDVWKTRLRARINAIVNPQKLLKKSLFIHEQFIGWDLKSFC
jgi:hypothetical protein